MDPMTIPGERKRRNVTVAQAARHLGIDRATWGNIESGKVEVTPEYADKMVEAMDAAVAESGGSQGG